MDGKLYVHGGCQYSEGQASLPVSGSGGGGDQVGGENQVGGADQIGVGGCEEGGDACGSSDAGPVPTTTYGTPPACNGVLVCLHDGSSDDRCVNPVKPLPYASGLKMNIHTKI